MQQAKHSQSRQQDLVSSGSKEDRKSENLGSVSGNGYA